MTETVPAFSRLMAIHDLPSPVGRLRLKQVPKSERHWAVCFAYPRFENCVQRALSAQKPAAHA
ncbi:MAG: hypothetical protein HWD60_15375 [Defluviicoccus sp.]|nr:MAG: hypothetical protein HWD60_15375 [Defluviicoccus sp.]